MLAGIMVDSNNFSGRTGVRTFEAASWLKRAGADTTEVKRFFQMSADDLKKKGQAIANAEITESGFAFARTEGGSDNSQIVNAQVADELLMFKGVSASFVLCKNEDGDTIVSARSLGDFNVQAIMEKLGGGGHFTSAAAKTDKSVDETEEEIKRLVRESIDKELFSDDDSKIDAITRRDTLF